MATGSVPSADAAGLVKALHRLRSTLARLKGELELAELDGVAPGPETRVALEEALLHLEAAELAALVGGRRVLVADDDERLAVLMARQLRREGFEVSTVSSGADLAAGLAGCACVVLDLSLVEAGGKDLAAAVRAARPIVVSGAVDAASRARAEELDAFAYLLKPVEAEILAAAVRRRMEAGGR